VREFKSSAAEYVEVCSYKAQQTERESTYSGLSKEQNFCYFKYLIRFEIKRLFIVNEPSVLY